MSNSKIEWTDETLQLTTGCTKASAGCANCYAERMHKRLRGMGHADYQHEFSEVRLHPENLAKIAKLPGVRQKQYVWRDGEYVGPRKRIFINSMSDLFHEAVPDGFIFDAFDAMKERPDVIFQILTKRADRMADLIKNFTRWMSAPNIWLGVTVENQEQADKRIPHLLSVPAAVRFVSVEPMLGPVKMTAIRTWQCGCSSIETNIFTGESIHFGYDGGAGIVRDLKNKLNWVICGGETGPGARPMHPDWVRFLRDQCTEAAVPFFFKGWGEWQEGSDCRAKRLCIYKDARTVEFTKEAIIAEEKRSGIAHDNRHSVIVSRIGKKAAGRKLDGRTWEEFPA
ncbi:MAG TPA: phage Gp37/Gp68 family protein [Nitrospirota bacterium]